MSQETVQKIGFGYIDDTDESLKSKASGKFGLNRGFLAKFELNKNAGQDGAAQDALDITIKIEDREYRQRIYPVSKVYDSNGNELTDTSSEAYVKAYNETWKQKNAVAIHILKAFRTEDDIKSALAGATSFESWATILSGLVPDDATAKPLDVFLEYQWNIAEGQDRTFLQLPGNMKGGYFVCAAQPGNWDAVVDENGLVYKNESGAEHPFSRNANYMGGNKANQQIEGQETSNAMNGSATGSPADAKSGTW